MMLQRFDGMQAAAIALAQQIAATLRAGIAGRGSASLVLAGGRTPVPLFHALRELELDWSRIGVTLTDERWVPEDQAGSNAALVRRELLAGRAAVRWLGQRGSRNCGRVEQAAGAGATLRRGGPGHGRGWPLCFAVPRQ